MADDERFQFSAADNVPMDTPIFREDAQARRIERLSRTVTFISILLPCLIGLLLYYGYRDLTGRMSRSQDSGLHELQRLNQEMQIKLDGLASRIDQLEAGLAKIDAALKTVEASFEKKLTAVESASNALEGSVAVARNALEEFSGKIDELNAAKLDKQAFAETEAKLNASLAPLQEEVRALGALRADIEALTPLREEIGALSGVREQVDRVAERIASLENTLGKDLNTFATYVEKTNKDMAQLQTSISALARDKVGTEDLGLELLKAQKASRLTLLQEITKLQNTMNTLQKRIDTLEMSGQRSSILWPPTVAGQGLFSSSAGAGPAEKSLKYYADADGRGLSP